MFRFLRIIAVSIAAFASGAANANFIVNGTFETGDFAGWTNSGATMVASDNDYRTLAGAVGTFPIGTFVGAFGGADLPATGQIFQDVSSVAGQQYLLSFYYGKFQSPGCCTGAQLVEVLAVNVSDGALLGSMTLSDNSGATDLAHVLAPYSLLFSATGPTTRLLFIDRSSFTVSTDGLLDNISLVAAVPEPAPLFLVGLGVAGLLIFAGRRRLH